MTIKMYHHKVTFKAASGDLKDDATTSFASILDGVDIGDAAIGDAVGQAFFATFLNLANPTYGRSLSTVLGKSLSRGANMADCKTYGPIGVAQAHGVVKGDASTYLGSPVSTVFGTLDAAYAGDELPRQAAVDLVLKGLGWEAEPVEAADGADVGTKVDRLRQRRTGRMKLGPWQTFVSIPDANFAARPRTDFSLALHEQFDLFRDELAASDINLAIWSRVGGSFSHVSDTQVPNVFGNAIRRKVKVTNRNLLPVD